MIACDTCYTHHGPFEQVAVGPDVVTLCSCCAESLHSFELAQRLGLPERIYWSLSDLDPGVALTAATVGDFDRHIEFQAEMVRNTQEAMTILLKVRQRISAASDSTKLVDALLKAEQQ